MKVFNKLCSIALCFVLLCSCFLSLPVSAATAKETGFVCGSNVSVRTSATINSTNRITQLSYVNVTINSKTTGEEVISGNNIWYHITYDGGSGYIYSEYVLINTYDSNFEANLSNFPQSYHYYLRALHQKYPNWQFVAHKLPLSFKDAVEAQYGVSSVSNTRKWVEFSYGGNEWRDRRAYNASSNSWVTLESRWTYASRAAIEFFMDPRNSLNEKDIFAFMQQSYNSSTQTKDALRTVVAGTFLARGYDRNSDGVVEADAYLDDIMKAAAQSGVSPYVLAATIIVEQGTGGNTGMVSGTYPGYEELYNFFNYKAYGSTTAEITVSALSYAKTAEWNSREAAIVGGAKKYSSGYINMAQDTYYYKDFNVTNKDWDYQYAASLYDAWVSAAYLQKGCVTNTSAQLVFNIPVYTDMPSSASPRPIPDGWHLIGGHWYYYSFGDTVSGWVKWNNDWYYLNPRNGNKMATNWADVGGTWYYFNADGIMLTGWQQIGGAWYYLTPSGAMHTGWVNYKGTWYYMNTSGAMLTGWQEIGGTWYYFTPSGAMLTGWQQIGGTWYYLTPSGAMHTGWLKYGNSWYYLNDSGKMLTGLQKIGGNTYYLDGNGVMFTGWKLIDGIWYHFQSGGDMHNHDSGTIVSKCDTKPDIPYAYCSSKNKYIIGEEFVDALPQTPDHKYDNNLDADCNDCGGVRVIADQWVKNDDGTWSYYKNGAMHTGWLQIGDTWYYMGENKIMQTDWQIIGGTWYYFTSSGAMHTGWLNDGGTWYYLGENGAMHTGWLDLDGNRYYFDRNGVRISNQFYDIGGNRYFDENGIMQKGLTDIDGYTYLFYDSGLMHTGWQKIDGIWYYFMEKGNREETSDHTNPDIGRMLRGVWFGDKDGAKYYFQKSGAMTIGWFFYNQDWYYFNASGALQTGWQFIGNKWYFFEEYGKMQIGWQQIDGIWYYLTSSGAMHTGWLQLGGTWYYLTPSGAMYTGWLWDNAWYYLKDDGSMAVDMHIDGGYINSSGIWS